MRKSGKMILPAAVMMCIAAGAGAGEVTVDSNGVMRNADGTEASYFGTNYTLPFAHSYREALRRGKDPKEAIREDVYHFSRLGFNGFRVHLWDVELADSTGNILPGEHLDLMDYLIAELEKRGIDILLTAQTNFGNGYPEMNIDTGSFSYDFPKCEIHDNPSAQKIQENYLRQLSRHLNPYTGKTYSADENIIGMEINNEPCHSASPQTARKYIDRMISALRSEGWNKPLFYNASHNFDHTKAFYESKADGMTFQWYPTGLVAGHERKGNMLPSVDSYDIPWKESIPQYGKKARIVYEFDPGDVMASYLYPATVRTFRKEGFQWITQFAYDAMFLAPYNTDYQTHYLNLAYTPGKALSMKIAGEAARSIERGADFGSLPQDTVFGDFRVSYTDDLSDFDNGRKYFHSNTTRRIPRSIDSLQEIAGRGKSPIVDYEGSGAYFLDRLADGAWRLEVMPDVYITDDPFSRPSPDRKVGRIVWQSRPMKISLSSLGDTFSFAGINEGNSRSGKASQATIEVSPGVYLLASAEANLKKAVSQVDVALREYHAPAPDGGFPQLIHEAPSLVRKGATADIEVTLAGEDEGVSLKLYPSDIDFWSENNTIYTLENRGGNRYGAEVPCGDSETFSYWISVAKDGEERTWPGGVKGNPLSWDFRSGGLFTSLADDGVHPVALLKPYQDMSMAEIAIIPDDYAGHASLRFIPSDGINPARYAVKTDGTRKVIFRKYVGDIVRCIPDADGISEIKSVVAPGSIPAMMRLVSREGASYLSAPLKEGITGIGAENLNPAPTYIIPAPFPAFLSREIMVKGNPQLNAADIEFVEFEIPAGTPGEFIIQEVLLNRNPD